MPTYLPVVIARESGRSSNRRQIRICTGGVYWMPRFRGA
jgi:hypothetical protein